MRTASEGMMLENRNSEQMSMRRKKLDDNRTDLKRESERGEQEGNNDRSCYCLSPPLDKASSLRHRSERTWLVTCAWPPPSEKNDSYQGFRGPGKDPEFFSSKIVAQTQLARIQAAAWTPSMNRDEVAPKGPKDQTSCDNILPAGVTSDETCVRPTAEI